MGLLALFSVALIHSIQNLFTELNRIQDIRGHPNFNFTDLLFSLCVLQFPYKVPHLVECVSVPTNLNDAVNNAMLNVSIDVIAISNCIKLLCHLSIDNTMVILIRQR